MIRAPPAPRAKAAQHLCADAVTRGCLLGKRWRKRHYRPHIKQRREEADAKRKRPGYKARRWVVERNRLVAQLLPKLLASFEKTKGKSYVALLALAAAMICRRETIIIYG